MKIIKYSLFLLLLLSSVVANAQMTDRDCIRMGNRSYRSMEMDNAVTFYQKALEKKRTPEAFYNLGCASLAMGDTISMMCFQSADSVGFVNPRKRAMNFHNMGNVWYMYGLQRMRSNDQQSPQYIKNAIYMYVQSLRCNPDDNETRYNLAMAQWLYKKMSSGGGGGQNDQKKDQKQEQQKQEQQKQDQQKKEQEKKEEKDQMSDQAAEQLLKSAQQDEKDVQRKVQAQPASRRSLEKDW